MPHARCSAGRSPASTSVSLARREFHKTCSHSARPSSPHAPSPAACIQTGCPDRSTCTACTNVVRNRTSDTFRPLASPATQFRIAYSAIQHAFQADLPGAVQRYCRASAAAHPAPPPCALLDCDRRCDRDPDIQVDGIWPQRLPKREYCPPDGIRPASHSAKARCVPHFSRTFCARNGGFFVACNSRMDRNRTIHP
jgi:hypothetical protein